MPRRPTDNDSSRFPLRGGISPTSSGLIIRIKDGESAAWERFVKLYTPLIRAWCKKPGGMLTRMDRQEISQEVLTKVAKSIKDFDEKREGRSLRAWLRTITQNAIADKLDYIAKRLSVSRLASDTGNFKYENHLEKPFELTEEPNEKTILLRQVMEIVKPEFSQRDWEIVGLFVNMGKSSKEVAEMMGGELRPDSVRRIKNRILARIRQEYAILDLGEELPNM